ncbi:MAG TPA: chemotaxis protein CheW [Gemmatimonadaceae bacterium]
MISSATLLFRVAGGSVTYGCDLGDAQEIIPLRPVTRLPGAPAHVRGLLNIRGTIITVLDLGVRLDPSRALSARGSIVLVRHGERTVGVVVEEVIDIQTLDVEEGGATEPAGAVVRGVASLNGSTVIVLDLAAMITQVLLS